MSNEVYNYNSSGGGSSSTEYEYTTGTETEATSEISDNNPIDARNRVLDAIIMAMMEARKSFRAQQNALSDSSYALLLASADKKDESADKALTAGVISGAAGIAGGAVNLGFTAKASYMMKNNPDSSYQLTMERGRASSQVIESSGSTAGATYTYQSQRDDAEVSRLEAEAEREKNFAEKAGSYGEDARHVEDKAHETEAEIRRSEHDTNVSAIT